jgi:predicted metal-dependent phosphotriesterase family hydrolase
LVWFKQFITLAQHRGIYHTVLKKILMNLPQQRLKEILTGIMITTQIRWILVSLHRNCNGDRIFMLCYRSLIIMSRGTTHRSHYLKKKKKLNFFKNIKIKSLVTITKVKRKITYPPRQGEGNKFRDKAMERDGFF